ncbi:MAG: DUF1501 domain-containing protein [Pirellulaceae bacterium]|nr:DUF1501 domain-containing protein [Pirellulaceae bacterium]
MLSILSPDAATNRRELMRIGGLSLLGLSAGQLESLLAANPAGGRAKSCVFLFLFGGPSQIDLWDMKPSAPAEIRGEFKPASTSVPGIQICEHLPRLAEQMDKICLIRSMTHGMNVHGPACSEIFTGRDYFGAPTTDQARDLDWPSMSSLLMRYGRSHNGLPASVVLPWYLQFPGQAKRIAGQTGGRMGERHNALLIEGDSAEKGFRVDGFGLQETVPIGRLNSRRELLQNLSHPVRQALSGPTNVEQFNRHRERAYTLLKGRAGELLDLDRETVQTRQRYGETMVGQSLLLARRLIEAGVSLITVNWEDETKTDGVNTCWDTHQNNFPKLKNLLCPIFDQAFPAFIADLHDRGLLDTTMVVAVGEFGRTPHMGQFSQSSNTRKSGRDHWPSVFTSLVAGGGVAGGQVYGESDHHGAQVKDRPVTPGDLSATVIHHLGIDPKATYVDEVQKQTFNLSIGDPVPDLRS